MLTIRCAVPAVYTPAGPCARNGQSASRALSAAHGQHQRCRTDVEQPILGIGGQNLLTSTDVKYHGIEQHVDRGCGSLIDPALGIFGTGQVIAKETDAKTIVDALRQDAAQGLVAFNDQHRARALFFGSHGRCQSRGASAYHQHIAVDQLHEATTLVGRLSHGEAGPRLVICCGDTPSSRAMISITRGRSNPP